MKKRNTSLEILRIIGMFLIIMHHFSVHGGYETLTYNNLSTPSIFIQLLSIFGKLGCQIFALISGYYLIKTDTQKNTFRIFKIILQLCFYSIIILIIVNTFNLIPITKVDIIKSMLPIVYDNWYVVNYILLLLLVPYLNTIILKLKKAEFNKLLIIVLLIWSIIPALTNYPHILDSWSYSNLDLFLVMYFIGAYIRLHHTNKYKNQINLLISIVFFILPIILTLIIDYHAYKTNNNYLLLNIQSFTQLNSPIFIICSVHIIIYCINTQYQNQIINKIASTTLGIYLLHDNFLIRKYIWTLLFPNINYIDNPYIHAIIKIILVFLVCSIIEYIRIIIFHNLEIQTFNKIKNFFTKKPPPKQ